jgi:hypothetical protein
VAIIGELDVPRLIEEQVAAHEAAPCVVALMVIEPLEQCPDLKLVGSAGVPFDLNAWKIVAVVVVRAPVDAGTAISATAPATSVRRRTALGTRRSYREPQARGAPETGRASIGGGPVIPAHG